MKWSHVHRQPVHYGLTPSAFSGFGVLLILAVALGLSRLLWVISVWLGF
jgi:hypothetical protein